MLNFHKSSVNKRQVDSEMQVCVNLKLFNKIANFNSYRPFIIFWI